MYDCCTNEPYMLQVAPDQHRVREICMAALSCTNVGYVLNAVPNELRYLAERFLLKWCL